MALPVRLAPFLLGAALLPMCNPARAAPLLVEVSEVQVAPAAVNHTPHPFFDVSGQLSWESGPAAAGGCTPTSTLYKRVTHTVAPRVDEVRCTRSVAGGPRVNAGWLVGLDAQGQVAWRRPLGFRSGAHLLDESVLGGSPEGVVLSNLTVVSPRSGKTVLAARTRAVGEERRPVPERELHGSALYLPQREAFAHFDADVSLVRRSGGLKLLDVKTGREQLLHPVKTTLLGGSWRVEELALSEDQRFLLLAQRLDVRGKGGVAP